MVASFSTDADFKNSGTSNSTRPLPKEPRQETRNKEQETRNRKTVVFDLGGVLIDWNPRYLYRKLMPDEASIDIFLNTICTSEWNAKQDAGRPFAEGVAELSSKWPDQAELIEAYHTRWIEMIGGPIRETVEILAGLRDRGTPLYALTNWSAETFALVRPEFEFLDWFRGIVVSGVEKQIKPDPEIYRILLQRYDLQPENLIFIDDSQPNIETARALGMDAVHFTSPAELRETLFQFLDED